MTETLIGLLMAALVVIIALILKIRRMVWLQRESDKQLKADVDKIEKDRTNLEECRSELEEITRGVQKVIDEFNIKYESMWRERNFDAYYIYKNCPVGTRVVIFDGSKADDPLQAKFVSQKWNGYDPTDPNAPK